VIGRATLAADRDDWNTAADLADRHLRQLPAHNRTERASALELLVRAAVARGTPDAAHAPLALLESIAADAATRPLHALTAVARGVTASGEGHDDDARRHFEDAIDLYAQSGATFERARATLDLAETLLRLGRRADAEREASQAATMLQGLDTPVELARARAVADAARVTTTTVPSKDAPNAKGLTPRELGVLRAIAEGHGNPAIAATLGISEHTVHRHVANIFTKLGVTSRAAAVAQAARLGLL
jgi:ATP/maltotriose-dependent transcriptional regulator MalT